MFVPASGEIYGLCDVEYRDVVESELQEKETTDRKVNKVDIKIGRRVFTPYKTAASDGSYDLSAEENGCISAICISVIREYRAKSVL